MINEAGELVKPFKWKFVDNARSVWTYTFKSGKENYECWFKPEGAPAAHAYEVVFTTQEEIGKKSGSAKNTGQFKVMEVLSTVVDIIKDFIKREGYVGYLTLKGAPTEEEAEKQVEVTKRAKVYYAVIMKNIEAIFGRKKPNIQLHKSDIYITF
jgi:hypothetical protein